MMFRKIFQMLTYQIYRFEVTRLQSYKKKQESCIENKKNKKSFYTYFFLLYRGLKISVTL